MGVLRTRNRPRPGLLPAAAVVVAGIAVGLGAFTFVYAKGYSYLGHDARGVRQLPRDERAVRRLDAGESPDGRAVAPTATCRNNVVGKYAVKAWDGFWHSYYFTANTYPDNIRITKLDSASSRDSAAPATRRSCRTSRPMRAGRGGLVHPLPLGRRASVSRREAGAVSRWALLLVLGSWWPPEPPRC